MNVLTIYPRGYTTGKVDAPSRQVSAGDLVADSLYDYLISSQGRAKNWKFCSQILDAALIHFGDFHEWLDTQLSNPSITGVKREFLTETIAFIVSGTPRAVNHASWMFMLNEVKLTPDQLNFARRYESGQLLSKELSTVQILQMWCKRPEGINDLITTLYVLFGHVGRTPA